MIKMNNPCIVILYGRDGFYRSNLPNTVNLTPDFFVFKHWEWSEHYKVSKSEVMYIEYKGKVIWKSKMVEEHTHFTTLVKKEMEAENK